MGIALVSGAGRGIGAATARELGLRGHHVVVNYVRDAAAAASVVADIQAAGGSAETGRADVCDETAVAALVDAVVAEHGRIDVLVCNANTVDPPFEALPALPWGTFIAKVVGELSGAYFLTQRVVEVMKAQRAGRVVHISSTAADHVGSIAAHSVAKAALNTYSRHVAADAGLVGVSVNTVALGPVTTDATSRVFTDGILRHVGERSVTGRPLRPEDVARVIAAVTDEGFAVTTGQVIRVDAGLDLLDQQLTGMGGGSRADDLVVGA
ncbi:SDR family oxidoreductase [Umezawaea tangerina]|uniref:3-oxoacyl-[acyl-carrier protein] reductase n=1 Tax=Umezawaea tangerina TaxID=84725 RepID=A0A2T0SQH8_9PSEU|nr:SDR family oxidoreductase [Umezawaea tangerina]PRY35623.1 3-oxoacyl-[acyl-carrier protein] reductase [Umezawaea tangerina]